MARGSFPPPPPGGGSALSVPWRRVCTRWPSPHPSRVCSATTWTEEHVGAWLLKLGTEFATVIQIFRENNINGRRLLRLTDDKLIQLGVASLGLRYGGVAQGLRPGTPSWRVSHARATRGRVLRASSRTARARDARDDIIEEIAGLNGTSISI